MLFRPNCLRRVTVKTAFAKTSIVLSLGATLAAAGCAGGERQSVDGLAPCGANAMHAWIGQPAGSLAGRLPGVRVLDPGSLTTYDFRPERLNIHVDSDGIVQGLSCG